MTERAPRRALWSKARLRALAWGSGAAAFVLAAAPLVAAPKPATERADAAHRRPAPRRVIVRHVTRRIVVVDPVVSAPVTVSTGGSTSGRVAAAPAPPATSTGAS